MNTTFLQQQLNILRHQAKALAEQIESMQIAIDAVDTPLPPIKEAEVSDDIVSTPSASKSTGKKKQAVSQEVTLSKPTKHGKIKLKYKSRSVKRSISPEQTRAMVDRYIELAKTDQHYNEEIYRTIIREFNLTCTTATVHNTIFYHAKNKGYEDIPTPTYVCYQHKEKDEQRMKAIKWLCRYKLNSLVVSSMLGVGNPIVTRIRKGLDGQNIKLTKADDKHFHKVYDNTLKEMGINV